ncbi:MAG: caspase family protein [Amaricoccus sp.]
MQANFAAIPLASALARLLLLLALLVGQARADDQGRRVALVIGNGAYRNAPTLANPPNDAADMAAKLRELGFEVVPGTDLDMAGFAATLRRFAQALDGADVALLFYAGHGLQVDGVNYLVPVDARIEASSDLDFQAVKLDSLIALMDKEAPLSIILLDACRNNPLSRALTRSAATPGLAPQSIASGSYIAFSTAPGNVAYDGEGTRNSPFTAALLENLGRENVDIRLMMADVRAEVWHQTREKQLPWENNSLIGRFYFKPGETQPPGPDAALLAERDAFDKAHAAGTAQAMQDFLATYPNGLFADIARSSAAALTQAPATTDDMVWRTLRTSVLPADFQLYLGLFPQGAYRDLAEARIAALDRAATIAGAVLEDGQPLATRADLRRAVLDKATDLPLSFVQFGLIALGYPIADPAGLLDAPTRRAIRAYQASAGAPQTGELTPRQILDLVLAAAVIGDQHAETAVGVMTASGMGFDQDDAVARLWLARAADQGNSYAQANLALLWRDGRGGPKDMGKARSLLQAAAAQGLPEAGPLLRALGG